MQHSSMISQKTNFQNTIKHKVLDLRLEDFEGQKVDVRAALLYGVPRAGCWCRGTIRGRMFLY